MNETKTDEASERRRAALIRQAERAIARDASVSGVTIMIPDKGGELEELYIPRRPRGNRHQ